MTPQVYEFFDDHPHITNFRQRKKNIIRTIVTQRTQNKIEQIDNVLQEQKLEKEA